MTTSQPPSDESQPDESKPEPSQPNNPLHGITLLKILEHLVEVYGWEELGHRIDIRCFTHDPSFKSSLKFLRRTEWARTKVERLYLRSLRFNHQPPTPTPIEEEPESKATTVFKWRKLPASSPPSSATDGKLEAKPTSSNPQARDE